MNTHKIKINFKINEILAVNSNEDIFEITNSKQLETLIKHNIKMKNKLLKIRNKMLKYDQDNGCLKKQKKIVEKKGQGCENKINTNSNYSGNKLCKLSESDHHRRLISYEDLDASFYTLNEESIYILNNNKLCKKNSDEINKSGNISEIKYNEPNSLNIKKKRNVQHSRKKEQHKKLHYEFNIKKELEQIKESVKQQKQAVDSIEETNKQFGDYRSIISMTLEEIKPIYTEYIQEIRESYKLIISQLCSENEFFKEVIKKNFNG